MTRFCILILYICTGALLGSSRISFNSILLVPVLYFNHQYCCCGQCIGLSYMILSISYYRENEENRWKGSKNSIFLPSKQINKALISSCTRMIILKVCSRSLASIRSWQCRFTRNRSFSWQPNSCSSNLVKFILRTSNWPQRCIVKLKNNPSLAQWATALTKMCIACNINTQICWSNGSEPNTQ